MHLTQFTSVNDTQICKARNVSMGNSSPTPWTLWLLDFT